MKPMVIDKKAVMTNILQVEHSQMQHLAANKQMMMLLQRMTSQLAIKTALDTKMGIEGGGGRVEKGVQGDIAGGTSFRRQRGVRAKRGESIKKAKPNHSHESSDRSPWLKQRYSRINTSDLSSDESGDSGRCSISSETCSSTNISNGNSEDINRLSNLSLLMHEILNIICGDY